MEKILTWKRLGSPGLIDSQFPFKSEIIIPKIPYQIFLKVDSNQMNKKMVLNIKPLLFCIVVILNECNQKRFRWKL